MQCLTFCKGRKYFDNVDIVLTILKQNTGRSTEGCSKLKRSIDITSSRKNGLNIRKMQVPNGTGPGVRRSKRPLFASQTEV